MATRVVHAVEDVQADLCNVAVLVHNYTTYLLSRTRATRTKTPQTTES